MASRKIEDLTPSMQNKYWKFDAGMKAAGIPYIVTCTARLVKEHISLYSQGRNNLDYVNTLRQAAGLPFITEKQNVKVTWTLKSRHLVDLDDSTIENDKSEAFDIAIKTDKKPVWDVKVDVDNDSIPDYEEAARIGESAGLRAGARFKNPDFPHFEEV
jgi:hypothetical protein